MIAWIWSIVEYRWIAFITPCLFIWLIGILWGRDSVSDYLGKYLVDDWQWDDPPVFYSSPSYHLSYGLGWCSHISKIAVHCRSLRVAHRGLQISLVQFSRDPLRGMLLSHLKKGLCHTTLLKSLLFFFCSYWWDRFLLWITSSFGIIRDIAATDRSLTDPSFTIPILLLFVMTLPCLILFHTPDISHAESPFHCF